MKRPDSLLLSILFVLVLTGLGLIGLPGAGVAM